MKAIDFEQKFEEDESIIEDLDMATLRKPNLEQRKVNVDFPIWMIDSLDRSARRLGVTRQSVIKMWLAERLEREVA